MRRVPPGGCVQTWEHSFVLLGNEWPAAGQLAACDFGEVIKEATGQRAAGRSPRTRAGLVSCAVRPRIQHDVDSQFLRVAQNSQFDDLADVRVRYKVAHQLVEVVDREAVDS